MPTHSADTQQPMVRFGLLADPQYSDHEPEIGRHYRAGKELIRRTLERLNQEPLDFICNLGDVVDGRYKHELPEVLELFNTSRILVKHIVGNHDMKLQSEDSLREAYGGHPFNEVFHMGGVCFVLLHSQEISLFRQPGTPEYQEALDYLNAHAEQDLKDYNGMLSDKTRRWFEEILDTSDASGEQVIVLTHAPICAQASIPTTLFWDAKEMLALLDRHHCVRAWLAGHHHPGGMAIRHHVLHKTIKGLCEMPTPTGCIVCIYPDRLEITGFGEENDLCFSYSSSKNTIL